MKNGTLPALLLLPESITKKPQKSQGQKAIQLPYKSAKKGGKLQSWPKYMRQTLVLM